MRIFASILIVMTCSFCAACGSASSSHDGSVDGPDGGSSADSSDNKDVAPQSESGSGDGPSNHEGGGTDSGTSDAESGFDGGVIVTAVTAGAHHVCALLSDGIVKCWGYNADGELGDGTNTGPETCNKAACSTTPVAVSALSGATAIAAGQTHTCALLQAGTVECWGANSYGQLGDGTTTDSSTPVAVSGLTGMAVTAVAAGANGTCALLKSGTVECWGANFYGQLGDGTYTGPQTCTGGACSMTPVAVSGLSGVTAIAVGDEHVCALTGGTVECFGSNLSGQLGDGTSTGPRHAAVVIRAP